MRHLGDTPKRARRKPTHTLAKTSDRYRSYGILYRGRLTVLSLAPSQLRPLVQMPHSRSSSPNHLKSTSCHVGDSVPPATRCNMVAAPPEAASISQSDVEEDMRVDQRFLEELPSRGAVGIAVRDHVRAISVLIDNDHPSIPSVELQNMRRMAMLCINCHRQRVHLPSDLPFVVAIVNLSGKQLCLTSGRDALALALILSPSGSMARSKCAVALLLQRARAENARVLVTLSCPYQVGVQNIAWEVRTLHARVADSGETVYLDGVLSFGSTNLELHAASPTAHESLFQPKVHEGLVKLFLSNFPVIDLDDSIESDSNQRLRASPPNREADEQTDSLVRRLAADRKKAIEDFRALEASAKQQQGMLREENASETALLREEIDRLDKELQKTQSMQESLLAGAEGACLEHQAEAAAAELRFDEERKETRVSLETALRRDAELHRGQSKLRKQLAALSAQHEIDTARWEIERRDLAARLEASQAEVKNLKTHTSEIKESMRKQVSEGTSKIDALDAALIDERCRRAKLVDLFGWATSQERRDKQWLKERLGAALRLGPNTFLRIQHLERELLQLRRPAAPEPPVKTASRPAVRTSEAATDTVDLVNEAQRVMSNNLMRANEKHDEAVREAAFFREREARRGVPFPPGATPSTAMWQVQPNGAVYNFALESDIDGVMVALQRVAEHARSGAVANAHMSHQYIQQQRHT